MPSISKLRLTNIQFEQGDKRFNDELFFFDGSNAAILLENGGGKTVLIQAVIQAMVPNGVLAGRKIRDTLDVTLAPAHIAVEWILRHEPRHYALTAVTFYMGRDGLEYLMYAYDYPEGDRQRIEALPLVRESGGGRRPATRDEIKEYYRKMTSASMNAKTFDTRERYQAYLEQQFQIVPSEWEAILKINGTEGGVERFFEGCKTTAQLVDRLLIPVVEQGLAGSGSKEFARMFDNQRRHFRDYLALNEQIKEHAEVRQRIRRIVEHYAALHRVETVYRERQGRAAGLYEYLRAESARVAGDLKALAAAEEEMARRREHGRRKGLSLEIARLRRKLNEAEARLGDLGARKEAAAGRRRDYRGRLESLRLAGMQAEQRAKQEIRDSLREQLERLDHSPDVARLRRELTAVSGGLRYHYDRREADLERQRAETGRLRDEAAARLAALEDELEKAGSDLKGLEIEEARTGENIKGLRQQMREIERGILDDPSRAQVPEQMERWDRRSHEVAADLHTLFERLADSGRAKEDLEKELRRLNDLRPGIQQELTEAETSLRNIAEKEKELLARWHDLSPTDHEINSLYLRPQTVAHRLEEETVRIENKRNDLLERERAARSRYDLYRAGQVFTADPALEKWAEHRQPDFPSLQLGVSLVGLYLEEYTARTVEDVYAHYPLWPVTLVAAASDMARLRGQLENSSREWTHPIYLLSDREARRVLEGGDAGTLPPVTPAHWPEVSVPERFQAWLDGLGEVAEQATAERRYWDRRWQQWKALQGQIRDFGAAYDHERVYRPLLEKRERAQKALQQCRRDALQTEEARDGMAQQIRSDREKQRNLEDEQNMLSGRLQQGQKWKQLADASARQTLLAEQLGPRIAALKAEAARIRREQKQLSAVIEQRRDELQGISVGLAEMRAEEAYRETREAVAVPAEASFEQLRERRHVLQADLAGVQRDRGDLERRLKETGREIGRLEKRIDRQRDEYGELITPMGYFPANGEAEIERLIKLEKSARKEWDGLAARYQKQRDKVRALAVTIGVKVEAYPAPEAEIMTFEEASLERAAAELKAERRALETEAARLAEQRAALTRLDAELKEVEKELDIAHGVHHFLSEEIPAIAPGPKDLQEYPYRRLRFCRTLVRALAAARDEVDGQRQTVDEQRKRFEDYCRRDIKDERTKQQALNGIQIKKHYAEIKEWAEHLQERIRAATTIAEESLRKLDGEVQHFINYLYTHLERICRELQTIPKMTAVKVENSRKEIFRITVPVWDEHEGRAKLRQHLEWMLGELEKEKFLTDQGLEDTAKIKKQLENWLHPKQLFQVIDAGQEIKVRCRKVTSDTRVSSAFTDWQRTEEWSGGERWSKNMTLFLGILNYLAEKRRHIRREKQNHRVVILDNPFGKASSDHVLAPVFFIARQLGFQFIALTAHAEGKFLRDHFPIIYSCRLRPTADPSIAVLTKEKEISRAFFRDTEPYIMERLGEMEQMVLL